jgi:hypothetical protein
MQAVTTHKNNLTAVSTEKRTHWVTRKPVFFPVFREKGDYILMPSRFEELHHHFDALHGEDVHVATMAHSNVTSVDDYWP